MSQRKLSERLDISVQAVWQWENGDTRPSGENLDRLPRALGIAHGEFWSRPGKKAA